VKQDFKVLKFISIDCYHIQTNTQFISTYLTQQNVTWPLQVIKTLISVDNTFKLIKQLVICKTPLTCDGKLKIEADFNGRCFIFLTRASVNFDIKLIIYNVPRPILDSKRSVCNVMFAAAQNWYETPNLLLWPY